MFGIELKREGIKDQVHEWRQFAKATPLQAWTLHRIQMSGGYALATDNVEDVKKLFETMALLNPRDKS